MKKKEFTSALDIGKVSRSSGLPVSTLRFYEEKGLIRSTARNGLRRVFPAQVLEQLEFIALGRRAGFSLEEIVAMFAADGRFQIDRKLLMIKADEIDAQIKQLAAVRDGLRHVAQCKAPKHLECPKFQKLLHLAGRSQARARGNQIA